MWHLSNGVDDDVAPFGGVYTLKKCEALLRLVVHHPVEAGGDDGSMSRNIDK